MKKAILFSLVIISATVSNARSNGNATTNANNETISFYDVPLVCGAAPEIGCGSKSKPVLLGLENKKETVSEAWLNRAGTVIAVVWKENSSEQTRISTAETIFKENKMEVTLISGKEEKKLQKDFESKQNWYRATDVDKLSMKEAGIISERLIARVNSKTPLTKVKSENLRKDFLEVLKNRFTKNYSSEINSSEQKTFDDNKKKMEDDLLSAGQKHLSESEMQALKDAITLGLRPTAEEMKNCKKDTKGCCEQKKTESKGCCKKK